MAKKQNELASGIIDTGTTTPPPIPDDGRASPPAPASLAYRAQQLHTDRRDASPPQPPVMAAAMPGPPASQQYSPYMQRSDAGGPSRASAPWPSQHPQYHPERRDSYQHSPTSPMSHHSPVSQRQQDSRSHHAQHTRQYSSSSTGSLGSLRDASGSDVSLPSFIESTGPPHHSSNGSGYIYAPVAVAPRTNSPPVVLPPIFTNRGPHGQPLSSHAPGSHVYHHAHNVHGGH